MTALLAHHLSTSRRQIICLLVVRARKPHRCSCLLSATPFITVSRSSLVPSKQVLFRRHVHISSENNVVNSRGVDLLLENKQKARELLDERIHPRGSFTPSHGVEAKHVLDYFKKVKPTDSESVSLSIALIERLVAERATSNDGVHSKWICEPRYFNSLFNLWKEAAKQGKAVISPRDLVQKLQTMSTTHKEFRYDIVTVNIIMHVVIKQAPIEKAPFIAEELLNFVRREAAKMKSIELLPDVFTYNNIIQAWAVSGSPEAPHKMEALLQMMLQEGIVPDEVTYNIPLRYWCNRGAVPKTEEMLEIMKSEGVKPSMTSFTQAIYCYTKVEKIEKAEELLLEMVELQPKNKKEAGLVGESVQNILLAYRNIVDDSTVHCLRKDDTVNCAEVLFEKMSGNAHLKDEDQMKISCTMTDIYSRAGKHDQVKMMSQGQQLDTVQLNILIKSLGKADKADEASTILKRMLSDSHADPTTETFGTLMNAWAESSRPDAVDQAFAVLRLMNENPKCIQLGIRPDVIIFGSLLKALAKSTSKDAGNKAVEILDEMERRYKAGDNNMKSDVFAYNLAIKTCLQVGDVERAELVMGRMEKSGTPPTIRTYNDILNHWSKAGTSEAAERAEQILMHMKQLAKTKNPDLKPNVFSYNITMNAWSQSGDSNACERMWKLYEQMKKENVEPDFITYTTLISFFTKSSEWREVLQRADILLQDMENSKRVDFQPDHRHYTPVIKGWLSIGDVDKASRVLVRQIQSFVENKNAAAEPNAIIINMVMQGWVKAGDLDRATSLINKMQALKDSNVLPEGPNVGTYKSLLGAWGRSRHPDKLANIQQLKERIAVLAEANVPDVT